MTVGGYTPLLSPSQVAPQSASALQSSSIARSSSMPASQTSSSKLEDDYRETPDNQASSILANDGHKEATSKESSTILVPVGSISKSVEGLTILIPAETSSSSSPGIPDKSLGQTSRPSDNASPTEQYTTSIPIVTEVGIMLSNKDELPLNHTLKPDTIATLPHILSPLEHFTEDPTSYFNDISTLSERVLNLHTDTLLRIETHNGLSVLPLPNRSFPSLETLSMKHIWLRTSITESIKIVSAIKAGTELLINEGFCSFGYNIIVVDAERPKVLRILPVSIPTLTLLCDLLHELVSKLDIGSSKIQDIVYDVYELLVHIVSTLGLDNSLGVGLSDSQYDSWPNICNLLSSSLSILHLGLLTFIRSHLDVTDITPIGLIRSALQIETLNGKVLMAPRRLSCLNGLVKKPVWAFSSHPQNVDSSTVDVDGFYVSTFAEDFAQLWGPVKVAYKCNGSRHTASIKARGGFLHQINSIQSSISIVPSTNETLCHWVNWLDIEDLAILDNPVSIDVTKRLLIGAYVTGESRRQTRRTPFIRLLYNCKCPDRYSFNYDIFELRTKPPSWKLDARTIQVGGGQYITVSMGCTYKFDAGWTLKDVIIETWLGSEMAELDSRFGYLNPRYLDYLVVLDISSCSGNARRISLWKLLNHPSVRNFLRRNLNKDFFQDLQTTLEPFFSIELIADPWLEMPPSTQGLLTSALKFLLTMLKFTGIRDNKLLQVWDITEVERIDGRKINPRWVSMLEDNDRCATFAIMTRTCISCHISGHRDTTGKTPGQTVLCTQLCITTKANVQERTIREPEQERKLASGAETFPKDATSKFSSKWGVPTSSNLATNQSEESARDDQSHVERELLERLRRRQSARQAVGPEVNLPSDRISALPENSTLPAASFMSTFKNHSDSITSGFEQQEQSASSTTSIRPSKPRNQNVKDLYFINGSGKTIGRLILEPNYGPKTVINLSRMCEESALTARWEPYDHGHSLLNTLHEREKAWDKRIGTWVHRSNGFVPRIFSRFMPHEDTTDTISVTEHKTGDFEGQ
jgi:hypothetical protein